MPTELKEFDWDAIKPDGMTELSLSHEYSEVTAAVESGMVPGEFRMLPYAEQAELIAYWYVNSRIKSFYANEQEQKAKKRQAEIDAKANANRKMR
jgi:hypothetical protein